MENPFNYLQFATGDQFYDRKEIRKDLLSRFLSGQSNVVLYGPRRYGLAATGRARSSPSLSATSRRRASPA